MKKQKTKKPLSIEQKITKRTVISFAIFLTFAFLAYLCWTKLYNSEKEEPGITANAKAPLRKALNLNEKIFSQAYSQQRLVKNYSKDKAAKKVRVNGSLGLESEFDGKKWKLQVIKKPGDTLFVSLDELKRLPKTEAVFEFRCIEGWSQISMWGGVRFSDFVKHYHLEGLAQRNYIGLVTPDQKYYVGIDMASALHPQTILCYEMNEMELPLNQGYPLRLIIPVKYGIKHLKRIGSLIFSNERPRDYWAQKGYDYYAGL